MNALEILGKIRNKWRVNGYGNFEEALNTEISKGSTGGEMVSLIAFYLFTLKKNNNMAYNIAKEDIENYLAYCESNGIKFSK